MKRANNLFPKILDWENLSHAVWRAAKGKRHRGKVKQFLAHCDQNLRTMRAELLAHQFLFGRYHQFEIRDPKPRMITAPAFSERVVHHAIISICEPYFEKFMIDQTFACRVGKGRIAAINQAAWYARCHRWYLKLDIRSFFSSINHHQLLTLLQRRFKDQDLLQLFRAVVTSFCTSEGRGLPIGSLTSQHFANFYLGWMDHFVKHDLVCSGYVRYMDDFVLWGNSYSELRDAQQRLQHWLQENLSLELKRDSDPQISTSGMNYLGCQIFPHRVQLNRRNRNRITRQARQLEKSLHETSSVEMQQRLTTLADFARQATTVPLSW